MSEARGKKRFVIARESIFQTCSGLAAFDPMSVLKSGMAWDFFCVFQVKKRVDVILSSII